MQNPLRVLQHRLATVGRRNDYIFLLSHMRGYTSLLSHIIGNHPEVTGYAEMHQSYRSNFGLIQLRYKSKFTATTTKNTRFLYDKILHDDYMISRKILKRRNVYPIIMVRQPLATMKSILNMGERTKVVSWYKEENKVANYYINRLHSLKTYAEKINGKCLFLEGQNLIDTPDKTLTGLTDYLKLNSPLQKEYDTFSFTGTVGLGDTSEHIKTGKIVKKRDSYKDIIISDENIARTQAIYDDLVAELSLKCNTI